MSLEQINQATTNSHDSIQEIIVKANLMINGSGSNTGNVTLSGASTVVTDNRVSITSVITMMPTIVSTAPDYIQTQNGSFEVFGGSGEFRYAITGS